MTTTRPTPREMRDLYDDAAVRRTSAGIGLPLTNGDHERGLAALYDAGVRAGLERAAEIADDLRSWCAVDAPGSYELAYRAVAHRIRAEVSAAPAPADTQPADRGRLVADLIARAASLDPAEAQRLASEAWSRACRGTGSDGTAPPTGPASTDSAQQGSAGTSGHPEGVSGGSAGAPVAFTAGDYRWHQARRGGYCTVPGCDDGGTHMTLAEVVAVNGGPTDAEYPAPAAGTEEGQR